MSEKHIPRPEHHSAHEGLAGHEHHQNAHEHLERQAEQARIEKSNENLAKIRELAQQQAETANQVKVHETSQASEASVIGMNHSLKASAYARTLARVQQRLPKAARSFSRVVHNPAVDKVSAASAQTLARPSGLLGGSIFAFVGSLGLLYYSKHYGFQYNYFVVFILFAGGFLVGGALELLVWLVYSRKQRYKS